MLREAMTLSCLFALVGVCKPLVHPQQDRLPNRYGEAQRGLYERETNKPATTVAQATVIVRKFPAA